MTNKLRRFFKLDSLREVYKFEDGKENLEPTGMQISDTLFKETMEFVMDKHLKDMDFLKDVSNIREQSKSQLQAILKQNDNEETVGRRLAELTQTVSEQNQTIRDLLYFRPWRTICGRPVTCWTDWRTCEKISITMTLLTMLRGLKRGLIFTRKSRRKFTRSQWRV